MEPETLIGIKPTRNLSTEERLSIANWKRQIFGEADLAHEWADPDWTLFVHCDGNVVSHLEIVERAAKVADRPINLAGIGNVMTPEGWRKKGLASAAMRQAASFMCEELEADFGLLLCADYLVPWYGKLGWRRVSAPLFFDQSTGKERWDMETMVLPCKEKEWPEGSIDLCGLPW